MKLYLIRHAQSEANVHGALDTALPGPPLTELGRKQAAELVTSLESEPVVAVYSSRAVRARQTADTLAMARDLQVQVIDGVHEVSAGALEGRTDREAIDTYLGVVRPWTRGELLHRMPGGETGHEVRQRFLAAVDEISAKHAEANPGGIVALVCHGGLIRLGGEWLADNVRPEVADKELLPNTAIVRLEALPGGGWHCLRWAELVP